MLSHSRIRHLIIFSLCAVLSAPMFVHAHTVSPLLIDIDVEQRELMTRDVTLTNTASRMVRIYATVNEVDVDANGEIKAFQQAVDIDRTEGVTSWLEISRGRIELQPGETKTIPLTIRVNPNAKAGQYHAFVGFPEASNKNQAVEKSMSGQAPGTIVRIAIDQRRTEFLNLAGFTIKRFVTDLTQNVLNLNINNTGEAELIPKGEVIFYDTRGNEVASMPVNTERTEIAAGNAHTFSSPIPESLKAGKYKAFLSLEYGSEQLAGLNDTVFFYVMPLSTMIMIFAGVLLFAVLLTVVIYRRMNVPVYHDGTEDVALYFREGRSEAQHHDIDLKNKTD